MNTLRRLLASCLPLLALACGEVPEDPDQTAPLARVSGTITNDQKVPVSSNLRMALVWRNLNEALPLTYAVAQDIPVVPEFPASFSLTLQDAPPAEVIQPIDQLRYNFRLALGEVVAYEDINGNGKLDLAKQGDAAYLDRIVGRVGDDSMEAFVVWIDPATPDANLEAARADSGITPRRGYNLLVDIDQDGLQEHWVDLSEPIRLSLSNDPDLQLLACTDGRNEGITSPPVPTPDQILDGPGPNGVWPSPQDPRVACQGGPASPDGPSEQTFSYLTCVSADAVCLIKQVCSVEVYRKPADPAAAAGWPCP